MSCTVASISDVSVISIVMASTKSIGSPAQTYCRTLTATLGTMSGIGAFTGLPSTNLALTLPVAPSPAMPHTVTNSTCCKVFLHSSTVWALAVS